MVIKNGKTFENLILEESHRIILSVYSFIQLTLVNFILRQIAKRVYQINGFHVGNQIRVRTNPIQFLRKLHILVKNFLKYTDMVDRSGVKVEFIFVKISVGLERRHLFSSVKQGYELSNTLDILLSLEKRNRYVEEGFCDHILT